MEGDRTHPDSVALSKAMERVHDALERLKKAKLIAIVRAKNPGALVLPPIRIRTELNVCV
jgi:hypothetical protein